MSNKLFLFLRQQRIYAKQMGICVCIAILSAGCASKDADEHALKTSSKTYHAVSDDINLTAQQKKIFNLTGELDKRLPKKAIPAVAKQYSHFLNKGRVTMATFSKRSENYLGHARKVFRDKGMPEELAFLAIVESGYNTTIKSHAGAAGAWQFMPYTGMRFGLHQDWWIDERLDPYEAVEAAATYLEKLHDYFGDWLLAIAAYNAGEGKIGRALKGTGTKDFFTLVEQNYKLDYKAQLRKETIDYVPRFLAITKIMRNLDALGFEDVNMNKKPQHARIEAKPGTDLQAMAKVVSMSWPDFKTVNSAHKQYVTHASKATYLYVPSHKQSAARTYAAHGKSPYAWKTVKVPKGETWSSVSKKTNVPSSALQAANNNRSLSKGGTIRIPNGPNVKTPKFVTYVAKAGTYKVQSGETLLGIAIKHNTSTKALMQVNDIQDASKIRAGQMLKIPTSKAVASNSKGKNTSKPQKKPSTKAVATTHKIMPGETLSGIAVKYDVSTKSLMQANNISDAGKVRSGQIIKIPTGTLSASTTKSKAPRRTHKVKSGDTYWAIARKYDLSTSALLELNKKSKSSTLRVGETLLVSLQ